VRPDATPLELTISRGGMLRGRIVGARDAANLTVEVTSLTADGAPAAPEFPEADAAGAFAARLAPGRHRVRVLDYYGKAELAAKDVEIREDEETSVELAVAR
jgi:hypothetical protein